MELSRVDLKAFFETGDLPTEAQFADLIDSYLNLLDDVGGASADVRKASLLIPSAQVLALNTTPQEIVPAPGANLSIQVIMAMGHVIFNTAAYAVNTQLQIITATAGGAQCQLNVLNATVNGIRVMQPTFIGTTSVTQLPPNQPLRISVLAGDPTTGDSDIKVFVTYGVVDVS